MVSSLQTVLRIRKTDEFFQYKFLHSEKKKTNLCAQNVFEVFAMCFSPELLNFILLKKKNWKEHKYFLQIKNNLFCSFRLAENIF